jgi:hypothetical protein
MMQHIPASHIFSALHLSFLWDTVLKTVFGGFQIGSVGLARIRDSVKKLGLALDCAGDIFDLPV